MSIDQINQSVRSCERLWSQYQQQNPEFMNPENSQPPVAQPQQPQTDTPRICADTPRTNEALNVIRRPGDGDKLDWVSFARQLERELSEAKKEIERLEGVIKSDIESFQHYLKKHMAEVAKLKADLNEALEALRDTQDQIFRQDTVDRVEAVLKKHNR